MSGPPRPLKRVRYFAGRLLTAADFAAEQDYLLDRWRRHNQWCHGYGIVDGLALTIDQPEIVVAPGLALDCNGDEIVLPTPYVLLLPTCPPSPSIQYLLITATEEFADPIPAPDTSESEPQTAHSRIQESARLTFAVADPAKGHPRRRGRCRPCGESHGVALGRLRWSRGRWRLDPRYRPSLAWTWR
jgi:hypothetical protein